jgi:hypothetical protein
MPRRLDWWWRLASDRPPRRTTMTRIRMGLPRLLLALAVAGCGGGGKTSGVASLGGAGSARGGQDDWQAALDWARCMRQHGINLPDPQITADGIDEQLPTGMRKDDPRLKAAWRACEQSGRGGT